MKNKMEFTNPVETSSIPSSSRKKRVLLRAPLLTVSGYGQHSLSIFKWLSSKENVEIYNECLRWGSTTWRIDPKAENGLIGKIMDRSQKSKEPIDVSIEVRIPNEFDSSQGKINVGITAGVETLQCNPKWVENCNSMDLIIVPSTHTKKTFLNSGNLTTPIKVVPEAFFDEIADPNIQPLELENVDTTFNFLMVGQLTGNTPQTDRKNTFNSLKYLCDVFKGNKEVGIILKANSGRNSHIDRKATRLAVEACLNQVRKGPYPKVHLLHGLMTNEEMAGLYRHPSIKAFVSLSRGEGWGLPTLEAAASGLPVIATDWSGHLDFMNHGKFIKVDYDLQEIPPERCDPNIFMKGTKWAEPKEKVAKRVLKKFYQSPEIPTQWAADLQKVLLEEYSQESINAKYDLALSELLT